MGENYGMYGKVSFKTVETCGFYVLQTDRVENPQYRMYMTERRLYERARESLQYQVEIVSFTYIVFLSDLLIVLDVFVMI